MGEVAIFGQYSYRNTFVTPAGLCPASISAVRGPAIVSPELKPSMEI